MCVCLNLSLSIHATFLYIHYIFNLTTSFTLSILHAEHFTSYLLFISHTVLFRFLSLSTHSLLAFIMIFALLTHYYIHLLNYSLSLSLQKITSPSHSASPIPNIHSHTHTHTHHTHQRRTQCGWKEFEWTAL